MGAACDAPQAEIEAFERDVLRAANEPRWHDPEFQ
jgi:hypothetical protein